MSLLTNLPHKLANEVKEDPRFIVLLVDLIGGRLERHEFLARVEMIIQNQKERVRAHRVTWCRCPDEFIECTGKCHPEFEDEHEQGVPA